MTPNMWLPQVARLIICQNLDAGFAAADVDAVWIQADPCSWIDVGVARVFPREFPSIVIYERRGAMRQNVLWFAIEHFQRKSQDTTAS